MIRFKAPHPLSPGLLLARVRGLAASVDARNGTPRCRAKYGREENARFGAIQTTWSIIFFTMHDGGSWTGRHIVFFALGERKCLSFPRIPGRARCVVCSGRCSLALRFCHRHRHAVFARRAVHAARAFVLGTDGDRLKWALGGHDCCCCFFLYVLENFMFGG